jgi:hypothetical protein
MVQSAGEGAGPATAAAMEKTDGAAAQAGSPVTITPADLRYPDVVRGLNQRYIGSPEKVQLVSSTSQVVGIVQQAVDSGQRLTVRSGGHCYEDFVFNPDVQVVLDVSNLNRVYYDPAHNAVAVESGATLLKLYQTLYKNWGVTIPAGVCYSVGVGGHVTGGGWGMLCRQFGLVSDHLYAVEVVVVDAEGKARAVVATREEDDPNRELWWAHTGGGGGNFGVVTRFWFRSLDATGSHPSTLLPSPPASVLLSTLGWQWDGITKDEFSTLVKNYCAWQVANSGPDNPYCELNSWLVLFHESSTQIQIAVLTQMDATIPNARKILEDYLATVTEGVRVGFGATTTTGEHGTVREFDAPLQLPWLQATSWLSTMHQVLVDPTLRAEYKSAYVRGVIPDRQIDVLYKHLTRSDFANPNAFVQLTPFGGKVNALSEDATASAHRDSAFQIHWQAMWPDAAADAANLAWSREFYQEMYADTGGVPVLDELTDGCYINYPDIDLGDPQYNKSSVPWHDLYYKGNYPRLQRVKEKWDPRNFFRHSQSIELPSA